MGCCHPLNRGVGGVEGVSEGYGGRGTERGGGYAVETGTEGWEEGEEGREGEGDGWVLGEEGEEGGAGGYDCGCV